MGDNQYSYAYDGRRKMRCVRAGRPCSRLVASLAEQQAGGAASSGMCNSSPSFTCVPSCPPPHPSQPIRNSWHVSNVPYGEQWCAGDVIGCCLDLDAGTMRFQRNGADMGEAFTNVRRAMPGQAYFAGISLSFSGAAV